MAASIKVSELQSLTQLSDVDLFLVTDTESSTSRRVTYSDLKVNLTTNLLTAIADLTNTVSDNNDTVNTRIDIEVATLFSLIGELQTNFDNLEIDIAPETLNSINELAAALGDNPDVITNLQSELTEYKAHIEARNLEAGLATGVLYAETIYGG